MDCTGVPPAHRGDYFRAAAVYVDGVEVGPDDAPVTQVSVCVCDVVFEKDTQAARIIARREGGE